MDTPMPPSFTRMATACTLAEGDKVLCVSEGKFGAAPSEHVAFYDIFRLENGKIVEHWDNIQTIPTDGQWSNPNGKFGF